MPSVLSGGYGAAVTVRWAGEDTEMVVRRRIPNPLATMPVERSVPDRFHRDRLGRVMGINEKGSDVPEPLEVGLTAFFKLIS